MSIKLNDELEARYALLTDYLLNNPNTVLKYKVLVELFGEDEAKMMTTYLGRFFNSINGMSQGKRRKVADTAHTIYFYLDQLCVPTGRSGVFKGVLYRCAPGSYVYDPDATYKVGGGVKNNRYPIYHSASAITPPKASAAEPEEAVAAPDEQLQLPFPAAGASPAPSELATTIIDADRANRESGRLSETPPSGQSLPFLSPANPFEVKVLARGDETIVIQTATEVITATIVVAVPR